MKKNASKLIYIILTYTLVVGCFFDGFATGNIHDKYFDYRLRFFGDRSSEIPGFIKTHDETCPDGNCPGYNLVINVRNPYLNSWDCKYAISDIRNPASSSGWPDCGYCYRPDIWSIGAGEPQDYIRDQGSLALGDGTIMLGNYIAYLASEWALFSRSGVSTDTTSKRLMMALETINRLDLAAETFYGQEPRLDGFFIRADMPLDFAVDTVFEDGDWPTRFGTSYNLVVGCEKRLHFECDGAVPAVPLWSAPSQDQIIGLLFGLRLVEALVSKEAFALDREGRQYRIVESAQEITDRIMSRLKSDKWVIRDPYNQAVCRGNDASGFSWIMAKAAKEITNKRYGSIKSWLAGRSTWKGVEAFYSPKGIASTGNQEILFIPLEGTNVNRSMIFKLAAITDEWAHAHLHTAAQNNDYDFFELVYALLHGKETKGNQQEHLEALNRAPINGPSYFQAEKYWEGHHEKINAFRYVEGWSAPFVLTSPHESHGPENVESQGEYNGMDYLLYHNIYCLYYDIPIR